jgi:hypothetical protein
MAATEPYHAIRPGKISFEASLRSELVPVAKADAGLLADRYQPPPNIFGNHDLWLHQF